MLIPLIPNVYLPDAIGGKPAYMSEDSDISNQSGSDE